MRTLFLADGRSRRWLLAIAAAALGGLVLGALGPFGSYLNGGPLARAGYWIGSMWAGLLFYGAGCWLSLRLAPPGRHGAWPLLAASVLVASVPEAIVTRLAATRIWPELARVGPGWATWYAQVATIGFVVVGGVALLPKARADEAAQAPQVGAPPPAPAVAAAERLQGDVLALQMEDHYVRVHRRAGSDLVLMPLGRAIEAVGVDGLRTHRSWWVARHAVERVEFTARSVSLRLTNGVVAPVSRSSVAHLRAAGWFE